MWTSYLINLDNNTTRLSCAKQEFATAGVECERVPGILGTALSKDEIARVYDHASNRRRARVPLVPAEIGCYLSHLECWRRIAEGDQAGGFIFEDDFSAKPELAAIMAKIEALDCRFAGKPFDCVKLFQLSEPIYIRKQPLTDSAWIGLPKRVPTCLTAYGLTRDAAVRLRDSSLPFFRPVDEDFKFWWEKGITVLTVTPSPVELGNQDAETGTIGDARREAAGGNSFSRLWRNLTYQARYSWGVFSNNIGR